MCVLLLFIPVGGMDERGCDAGVFLRQLYALKVSSFQVLLLK